MTTEYGILQREIARRLCDGAAPAPEAEATLILVHVSGRPRGALATATFSDEQAERARRLADRRATTGEPLQYVLGTAVSGALDLAVGPGVFIPRPETELLVDWALRRLPPPAPQTGAGGRAAPIVVDLCAGSGTVALEIAHARPDCEVHAVELDPDALMWLQRNAAARVAAGDRPVTIHAGDATSEQICAGLDGRVAAVVTNPPYIPAGTDLPAEVVDHEPARALFGGPSGNEVIARLVPRIATLLVPGGFAVCEHDDATGDGVAALFAAHPAFGRVRNHHDLTGRPRFVTAYKDA